MYNDVIFMVQNSTLVKYIFLLWINLVIFMVYNIHTDPWETKKKVYLNLVITYCMGVCFFFFFSKQSCHLVVYSLMHVIIFFFFFFDLLLFYIEEMLVYSWWIKLLFDLQLLANQFIFKSFHKILIRFYILRTKLLSIQFME